MIFVAQRPLQPAEVIIECSLPLVILARKLVRIQHAALLLNREIFLSEYEAH